MTNGRRLSEVQIAHDLGHALSERLLCACIRDLQRMPEPLLSGEFSGLQSVWDEICVQQQRELSFSWQCYLETMFTCIEWRVCNMQPYEVDAIWLLTQEGDDWDFMLECEREAYPVVRSDVVAYLQDELLSLAINWSNERINQYLKRGFEWD